MEIGKWNQTKDLNDIYRDARDQGLEANLAELDNFGYTVIEDALSPELNQRCVDAIFRVLEERSRRKPDPDTGEGHPGMQLQMGLLFQDRAFEEALMTRPVLTLMSYLLGKSCMVSTVASHLKSSGGIGQLPLHGDNAGQGLPAPFAPYAQIANCNYALTDYTEIDDGVLSVVPGSHKLLRYPFPHETDLVKNRSAVPVFVPKGSAVIWHGNLFHGSYARKKPGWRINLANLFCRDYMDRSEAMTEMVTQEMLDRNPPRFAKLLGVKRPAGWCTSDPSIAAVMRRSMISQSQHS